MTKFFEDKNNHRTIFTNLFGDELNLFKYGVLPNPLN